MNSFVDLNVSQNCSIDAIESETVCEHNSVTGRFQGLVLRSHFQPIFSLSHRRAVGYEALVRPQDTKGQGVPPNILFNKEHNDRDTVFLDRLCRDIHLRNFVLDGNSDAWLFLNVNARVALHGKKYGPFFESLLTRYGVPPSRIVIELLENDIQDERLLAETMRYYTELGCLVAIDDFGAGHSNFERIWHVQPHIVKLDRSMLVQARERRNVRGVLSGLVAMLQEMGCLTLIEGVETEEEAMISMDSGIDFVQGFFFARPAPNLEDRTNCSPFIGGLCHRYSESIKISAERNRLMLKPYLLRFHECANLLSLESDPGAAAVRLFALPLVVRCYLLDMEGRQLGDNIQSPQHEMRSDPRFRPIADPNNANWSRRHYYQRALSHPGEAQISRPYLSITDAKMCITISIALLDDKGAPNRVFCADISWEGN